MNNPYTDWYYASFFQPYVNGVLSFNKCLMNLIHREKWERGGENYAKLENPNTRKNIAEMVWNIRKHKKEVV